MPLTFGELREIVSPYAGRAGKNPTSAETAQFAWDVMQHLLFSGDDAGIRKVTIMAYRGLISLPPEIETPLKARIGNAVAETGNKWAEFRSGTDDLGDCPPLGTILSEEGSESPLVYDLPTRGSKVGVMAHCYEDKNSHVIVQGKDVTGREIFMPINGKPAPGEQFSLQKGAIRFGQVEFGEITGVVKSKTNGYVTLFAVDPKTGNQQFLADWTPNEERPMYRRFRVISRSCPPIVKVSMLCRVRLKDSYHDNDITIFDNRLAITMAAQRIQAEVNNDNAGANYKREALNEIIENEAGYKKRSGQPIDVFYHLSGGSIKNIV